jgi:dTDP-4-dehydrorhamnose reductase
MKILILGHNGMLGNAVKLYLEQYYDIEVINSRYPSIEFQESIKSFDGQYIINCIGAIPQKTNNFDINSELPIFLDQNTNCTIIHPSTDCESDDTEYGVSKRNATKWLLENSNKSIIFKTSIIGIELNSADSLLCWFLKQNNATGYTAAMWNGITTLEWAKQCKRLIDGFDFSNFNVFCTKCISKYELLNIIKQIYLLDVEITPINGIGKNKCLNGIELTNIQQQIKELKEFYDNSTLSRSN